MNWQTYFACNFCGEPFKTRVKLKCHKWEKHCEAFQALLSARSVQDAQTSNHPVVELEEGHPGRRDLKFVVFGERETGINNIATESGGTSSNASPDRAKETDNCGIIDLQPSVQINERVESEGSVSKNLSEGVQEAAASCSPSELQPRVQINRKVDSGLSSSKQSTESVKETGNCSSDEIQFLVQINKRVETEGSCSKESTEGNRGTVICSLSDVRSSVQTNERVDTEGSSSQKSTEGAKGATNCSPSPRELLSLVQINERVKLEGSSNKKSTEVVKDTASVSLSESQSTIQINERVDSEGFATKESAEGVKETAISNLNQPSSEITKNAGDHTYLKDPAVESLTCLSQEQIGEQGGKGSETSTSQVEPREELTTSSDRVCVVAKRKIQETDSPSESPSKHLRSRTTENSVTNYPEGKPTSSLQTGETVEHLPAPVPNAVDLGTPLREAENNATNSSSPAGVRYSPRLKYHTEEAPRVQKLGMAKTSSIMGNDPKQVTGKRRKTKRSGVAWYDKKKKSVLTKPAYKRCIACGQKFNSNVSLNAHFQAEHEHQKPELPCAECELLFWNEWRLRLHIKRLHSIVPRERNNSNIYTCEKCSVQCGRAESMRKHLRDKHGIEAGLNEGNLVPTANGSSPNSTGSHDGSEFDHVEVSKGKFLCIYCDEHFSSQKAWYRHVENVHKSEHQDNKKGDKIQEGSKEYATMPKLSPVATACKGPNDVTTPSPRKEACPLCQEKFQYRMEVNNHMKKKHHCEIQSTAHIPGEIQERITRATRRVLTSIPTFGCPLCSAEFEGRDLQMSHLQADHHFKEADAQDLILHGVDAQNLKRGNDNRSMKSSQMVKNNCSTTKCYLCKKLIPSTDLAEHVKSHCRMSHRSKETVRGRNLNAEFQDKEAASYSSSGSSSSSAPSSASSSSSSDSDSTESPSDSADPLLKLEERTGLAKSSAKNSKVRNPAKNKKKKGNKIAYVCHICNKSFNYQRWYKRHLLMHKPASSLSAFKSGRITKKNIPKKSKENSDAARKKKPIDLKLTCALCEGKFACEDVLRDHLISNHRVKKQAVADMVEDAQKKVQAALASKTARTSSCQPSARSSKTQRASASKNVEKVARGQQKTPGSGFKLEHNVTFPNTSNPRNMESNFRNVDEDQGNVPIQILVSVPASIMQQGNFPSVERIKDGISALIRNEVPRSNEESPGKGYLEQDIKKEANDGYIFRCDVCGIRYDGQDKLDEHKKCHLVKEKLYQCQECYGTFTSRKRLQNHLLIKHRPKV